MYFEDPIDLANEQFITLVMKLNSSDYKARREAVVAYPYFLVGVLAELLNVKLLANYFGYRSTREWYNFLEKHGLLWELKRCVEDVRALLTEAIDTYETAKLFWPLADKVSGLTFEELCSVWNDPFVMVACYTNDHRVFRGRTKSELMHARERLGSFISWTLGWRLGYRQPSECVLRQLSKHCVRPYSTTKQQAANPLPLITISDHAVELAASM